MKADTEWKGRAIAAMREAAARRGADVWTSLGEAHILYVDALRLDVLVTLIATREQLASALERMAEVVRAGQDALAGGRT